MRKFLFVIAAALLAVAMAAPAQAIDFKMTGLFWMEGVSADDADKNSRLHDGKQFSRFLMRPRFHAIAEGGKIWAISELDVGGAGFRLVGVGTGRADIQGNRHVVDFLIPGTQLRFRFGKTDWVGPSGGLMGSGAGQTRGQGFAIYGKLTNKLSLWAHDNQYNEDQGATAGFQSPGRTTGEKAENGDTYQVRLTYQASPNLAISPFVFWDFQNGIDSSDATPEYDIFWYGLHVKGKAGILSYEAMGILQNGKINFSQSSDRKDIKVRGAAGFADLWLNFGKLRVGTRVHFTSGDDDPNANGLLGNQRDNKISRFSTPRQNNSGWAIGPQLITERRFNTMPIIRTPANQGTGNGGAEGNGLQFYELQGAYALTKSIGIRGWVSFIRSTAKRAGVDANNDGDVTDSGDTEYTNDKDIGTEVDLGVDWKMYKNLTLTTAVSYLFAGDYGKTKSTGGVATASRAFDDTWALFLNIRYTF
ncbi:MAG: hypothetical protein O2807_03050 [bacterium]|nr:hypothetical protein [bacterium]